MRWPMEQLTARLLVYTYVNAVWVKIVLMHMHKNHTFSKKNSPRRHCSTCHGKPCRVPRVTCEP